MRLKHKMKIDLEEGNSMNSEHKFIPKAGLV